jgi:predicted transcriptional regulator
MMAQLISFEVDRDLAERIGKHAANTGMTGSAWVKSAIVDIIGIHDSADEEINHMRDKINNDSECICRS